MARKIRKFRIALVASPATCWAMPHKISNSDTNLIHKNTLQMHRFIQNNNINIHAAYTGKTHENNCININTTHELTYN
jgi:hypothetical protein